MRTRWISIAMMTVGVMLAPVMVGAQMAPGGGMGPMPGGMGMGGMMQMQFDVGVAGPLAGLVIALPACTSGSRARSQRLRGPA